MADPEVSSGRMADDGRGRRASPPVVLRDWDAGGSGQEAGGAREPVPGSPLFAKVAPEESGITFVHPLDLGHPMKRLYHGGFAVGGVAIGDVDGDLWPDVFLAGGPVPDALYRNRGGEGRPWSFEEVTGAAGLGGDGDDHWSTGASFADIDGDGDLDLHVCRYEAPNALFINDGAGRFVDRAAECGLDFADASLMPSFCDVDGDGDLDCFVLTYRRYREGGWPADRVQRDENGRPFIPLRYREFYQVRATGEGRWTVEYAGRPDRLFLNEGIGGDGLPRFVDVSERAGIFKPGHGLSATWWDFDADGRPDLYVGNDFNDADRFYRNNGDGTFTDVVRDAVPHTSWFSMGADAGDVDNDGRLDLLTADMSSTTHFEQKVNMGGMADSAWYLENLDPRQNMRNALYLNTGTPRFMEVAHLAGLADSDWTWSVKFADLDLDGRLDVFVSNGVSRNFTDGDFAVPASAKVGRSLFELYEDRPPRLERNLAFRNLGDLRFEPVAADWGLDELGMSYGAATGDLDRDGDLDFVVANLDAPVSVFRSAAADRGRAAGLHRVVFRLRGKGANRQAIGARVTVCIDDQVLVREMFPASGFLASHEPIVHFGLGRAEVIDTIEVRWPGGGRSVWRDVPADREYRLEAVSEGAGELEEGAGPVETVGAPEAKTVDPWFWKSDAGWPPEARHRERAFDDFARQPLLPNRLSRLGPPLAVGDVDGDGRPDLFLGGAAGQPGRLFRIAGGRLEAMTETAEVFAEASEAEDLAALFFDADGDRAADLLVVSGGIECEPGDETLRDRLYRNDGEGRLTHDPDALPDLRASGAAVAAGDLDGDGDPDVFIGGRTVPGRFPETPASQLLVNDGTGRFTDETDRLAPGLAAVGMVTDAAWADVDGDARPDLVVACEWGPVRLWRNAGDGRLEDVTGPAGLAGHSGWWDAIAALDVDGDGDADLVAGNTGLNTKYHASPGKPVLLYYGDFGGDGNRNLVEAEFEGGVLFPVRGRSCSTAAMPHLADRFRNFREFAGASLEAIYGESLLEGALQRRADTLESGIFLNDGDGRFRFQPFARIVQAAPVRDVAAGDFDGDGRLDLALAQNFFGPQPETGRFDGGVGMILRGDGAGAFTPVSPAESGFVVPGDAPAVESLDLDGDAIADLVVLRNDDDPLLFLGRGPAR